MRLLKTQQSDGGRALVMTEIPGKDIPPYAILSHTWSTRGAKDEVTFEDIKNNTATAKAAYAKICWAKEQARNDSLDYIWIDTCCIDKTSSVELSEAINSMWRYYAQARTCYAYLADLQGLKLSSRATCRWFFRGWTLQELLAPTEVHFFNKGHQYVGSRTDLATRISAITGIDQKWLMGAELKQAGVAARMSWAANRETTRAEDMAYCLIGLFDVNMVMLYGEGELKAFRRLQEEILKVREDHSIFAWIKDGHRGIQQPAAQVDRHGDSPVAVQKDRMHKPGESLTDAPATSVDNASRKLAKTMGQIRDTSADARLLSRTVIDATLHHVYLSLTTNAYPELHGLLADSPKDFQYTGFVRTYTRTLAKKPPKMTARGVNIQLPIWKNGHHLYAILSCPAGDPPSSFLAIELMSLPNTQEQYARSECYVLIAIPHTCKLPAATKFSVPCDPVSYHSKLDDSISIPLHIVSVARTHETPAGRWRHVATYQGDDALADVHPADKARLLSAELRGAPIFFRILKRRLTAQAVLKFINDKDGSSFVLLLGTDTHGQPAFNICDDDRHRIDGHYRFNLARSDDIQWYSSNSDVEHDLYSVRVQMKRDRSLATAVLQVQLRIAALPGTSFTRLRRRVWWTVEKGITLRSRVMPSIEDVALADRAGVIWPPA